MSQERISSNEFIDSLIRGEKPEEGGFEITEFMRAVRKEVPCLTGAGVSTYLDLGCGADTVLTIVGDPRTPDGCISAVERGWVVTGVDKAPMRKAPQDWTFIQGDITEPDFFSIFTTSQFDLIEFNGLVGITHTIDIDPHFVWPGFEYRNDGWVEALRDMPGYIEFMDHFFRQICRILKPGGLCFVNYEQVLRKTEDRLKKLAGFQKPHIELDCFVE